MLIAITCEHIIIFYFIEMGFNDLLSALQVSYIQFQKRNTDVMCLYDVNSGEPSSGDMQLSFLHALPCPYSSPRPCPSAWTCFSSYPTCSYCCIIYVAVTLVLFHITFVIVIKCYLIFMLLFSSATF